MGESSCDRHFTRAGYRELLVELLEGGYTFRFFDEAQQLLSLDKPFVLLRHDLDVSVLEALPIAEIERELGIQSTFFVRVQNSFYNPFSPDESSIIWDLLKMGHKIGLHFDTSLYAGFASPEEIAAGCAKEISLLEVWFETNIEIVSFHRPTSEDLQAEASLTAGVPHTYLPLYVDRIAYCSDSSGQWRFGHPMERDAVKNRRPFQLLVHPIWWRTEPQTPHATLEAFALDSSSRFKVALADDILASFREVISQFDDDS